MIRRRLIVGTASNFAGRLSTVITWFLLTPFVLEHLGTQGFALWTLLSAVTAYGTLLDFGISGAVVKYVAEHTARGERDRARRVIASAVWLYCGIALAAVALSAALAPPIAALLDVSADQRALTERLVVLAGVNVGVVIALGPAFAVLRGLQRHDLYNAIKVCASFPEAAGVIFVLLSGWGVAGLIGVSIVITFAAGLVSIWLIRGLAPDYVPYWRGASLASIRQIARFSLSTFTIDMSARVRTRSDEFVIAMFRPLSAVTPYALARKLGELTELVGVQFLKVVMPLASELEAAAQGPKLQNLYVVASRLALGAAAPVAVVLIILGDDILRLWVGAEYAEHAPLVVILAVAGTVSASQWPAVDMLQGMAKHRLVAAASLSAAAANVVLSIVLLPVLGLTGVALGTLIPALVVSLGIIMPFANATLRVSWSTALRDIWTPVLLPAAVSGAVLAAIERQVDVSTLLGAAGAVIAAILVYVAAYLCMPPNRPERQLLVDAVNGGSQTLRALRPGLSRLG